MTHDFTLLPPHDEINLAHDDTEQVQGMVLDGMRQVVNGQPAAASFFHRLALYAEPVIEDDRLVLVLEDGREVTITVNVTP